MKPTRATIVHADRHHRRLWLAQQPLEKPRDALLAQARLQRFVRWFYSQVIIPEISEDSGGVFQLMQDYLLDFSGQE